MQKVTKECPEFGILVIGETGDGKSTLVNSLLGADVVAEGNTMDMKTTSITAYKADIAGVPVAIYDTPGINASSITCDEEVLSHIKELNKDKKIHLVIFCFPLREVCLKANYVATLKSYQAAGVDWTNAIIALTFADLVNAQTAPKEVSGRQDFNVATYFKERVQTWEIEIRAKLVADIGVPQAKANATVIRPVTDDQAAKLPDGEDWFIPLWLDILDCLPPAAYVRFLQMYRGKISFTGEKATIQLMGADAKRFQEIADKKISDMKKAGLALLGGTIAAGIGIGTGIGAAAAIIGITGALSFGIAIPLAVVGVAAGGGTLVALGGAIHHIRNYFKRGTSADKK